MPKPTRRVELEITQLGAQGDGVAELEGAPVYVPFALPGERIEADVAGDRGVLVEVLARSPDRVAPRCPAYTLCGGCNLQHLSDAAGLAFKREQIVAALAARGLAPSVEATLAVPLHSRRRAVFAATRGPKGVIIGFRGRRTHDVVPIDGCVVLAPALLALAPALTKLAAIAAPRKGPLLIHVTQTEGGPDVDLSGAEAKARAGLGLSGDDRQRLILAAQSLGLARLSIDRETLIEYRAPVARMGAAFVTPPPAGFLQAVAAAEETLARLAFAAIGLADSSVLAGSRAPRSVADLFAGSGAFALRLASLATVHAFESEAPAMAALETAARATPGLRPVICERRDLFRRPLNAAELAAFDAVVLDPPRAGAEAQCEELARAAATPGKKGVRSIAYVSCNPATLARDLRVLADGGWRIVRVTAVDQFQFSPHAECVAALTRP